MKDFMNQELASGQRVIVTCNAEMQHARLVRIGRRQASEWRSQTWGDRFSFIFCVALEDDKGEPIGRQRKIYDRHSILAIPEAE